MAILLADQYSKPNLMYLLELGGSNLSGNYARLRATITGLLQPSRSQRDKTEAEGELALESKRQEHAFIRLKYVLSSLYSMLVELQTCLGLLPVI